MRTRKLQAAAQSIITVTSTATGLFDLMQTASKGSENIVNYFEGANTVLLNAEDGDCRYLFDNDPTASVGTLLLEGEKLLLQRVDLEKLTLIRAGAADVTVSVQIFESQPGESSSVGGSGGGGGGASASGSATTSGAEYQATSTGRDGTVVYASASTLTLTGTPFTVASEDLVYIKEVDETANTANIWFNGVGNVQFEISGTTITKTGGDDFSANGVYELGYNGQRKPYDSASSADRQFEVAPISSHHVEETLLDLTNIATNTTGYAYIDMDGYRSFSFQGETSGTTPTDVLTVTVEATNQDDGTAPASCTYQDVTSRLFTVASAVDTDFFWIADTQLSFKYVRIKYVTSNDAGNDADLTVYAKRIF